MKLYSLFMKSAPSPPLPKRGKRKPAIIESDVVIDGETNKTNVIA